MEKTPAGNPASSGGLPAGASCRLPDGQNG